MNIEAKSLMDLAGWLVSLRVSVGGTIAWVKFKLKSHDQLITAVEGKFITENSGQLSGPTITSAKNRTNL